MSFSSVSETPSVACFITSHGFGHATRASAVLQALGKEKERLSLEIFSSLPDWFWKENLSSNIRFRNHQIETDVGLFQKSPFEHDLDETITRLEHFLGFSGKELEDVRRILRQSKCDLILCDISPLGLFLGNELNIPTVLVENFTWDWIYDSYVPEDVRFKPIIEQLKSLFESATLKIQTTPLCKRISGTPLVPPIFRKFRDTPDLTRQKLGLSNDRQYLLISTGGIPQDFAFLDLLKQRKDLCFVVAGNFPQFEQSENLTFLPHRCDFHFPDLVRASSGLVGKLGYGTVAEAWGAGTPLFAVYRENFRESVPLKSFVRKNISNLESTQEDFLAGNWIESLDEFLALDKHPPSSTPNGALEAAALIWKMT